MTAGEDPGVPAAAEDAEVAEEEAAAGSLAVCWPESPAAVTPGAHGTRVASVVTRGLFAEIQAR
jgi:hypothetical protein